MIFAASIISPGVLNPAAFLVKPSYTRVDGTAAPNIEALPVSGLFCTPGDIVFCAEGINDFAQNSQMIFNDNGGAYPLIFGTLASPILIKSDEQILGKMTLGLGTYKMVLGDQLATWAQSVDAALTALYSWGTTCTPPFPNLPVKTPWNAANLSQNHTLD